jgi:hypothetical protein
LLFGFDSEDDDGEVVDEVVEGVLSDVLLSDVWLSVVAT